ELGDARRALRSLRRVSPGALDAGEALLTAARLVQKTHKPREAAQAIEEVLAPIFNHSARGDPAAAHLLAGDALLAAGDKARAPADVARAPTHPADPLACRAKLAQGRALRRLKQLQQARAALAPVVLRCADPAVRAPALFVLAQVEALTGQRDAEPLWLALAT